MNLAHPERLWLLLVLPPLLSGRRTASNGERATGDRWGRGRRRGGGPLGDGAWAWLVAIGLLIVALAQPRWGLAPAPPLPPGQDVVFLVDTSRSMAAEDAIPNRLGVAVEAAESLVSALGKSLGPRAALVAFSGRGMIRCPLTENLGAVAEALQTLRPGDVQPGGTNLGAALDTALDAFDEEDHAEGRTIVLFSDGEDHAEVWPQMLERLRAAGVVVHSVAIGDPVGGHEVPLGPEGGDGPLKYHGDLVLSRRHDEPFEALARETGGAVVRLGLKTTDLGELYSSRVAPVARQRRIWIRAPERLERFAVFVAGALAIGLAGSWPGRRWFVWRRRPARAALAALAALVLVAGSEPGVEGETATQAVAAGQRAYASGDVAAALAAFERAIDLDPGADIPRYDAAAALFQLRRYGEALPRYVEARRAGRRRFAYQDRLRSGQHGPGTRRHSRVPSDTTKIASARACRAQPTTPFGAMRPSITPSRSSSPGNGGLGPRTIRRPPRRKSAPKSQPPPGANRKSDRSPKSTPSGNPDMPSAPSQSSPNATEAPEAGSPQERLASALRNVREAQPAPPERSRATRGGRRSEGLVRAYSILKITTTKNAIFISS